MTIQVAPAVPVLPNTRNPNRHRRLVLRNAGAFVLLLLAIFIAGQYGGIRWNRTASLPTGLYRMTSEHTPIIAFCPEGPPAQLAIERGYRTFALTCADHHAALMKPVAAEAGDTVTITKKGIAVNGRPLPNTQQFQADNQKRPMHPWPLGTYIVAPGTFWAISTYNKYSYDSRYFGPVPARDVISYVKPLWISR